jgi:hypothetical protein
MLDETQRLAERLGKGKTMSQADKAEGKISSQAEG